MAVLTYINCMNNPLLLPTDYPAKRLTAAWVVLAVTSLMGAGVVALLLVGARSESYHELVPFDDLFTKALIIHVNLSVMVWFLSIVNGLTCMLIDKPPSKQHWLPFWAAAIGAAIFSIAPFVQEGEALLNNYVPIIDSQIFYLGIGLFLIGALSHSVWLLPAALRWHNNPQQIGLSVMVVMNCLAFLSFFWSYNQVLAVSKTDVIGVAEQMEMIFWGGGHVLQFTYTHAMLIAWVWLAALCGLPFALSARALRWWYVVPLMIVLPTPLIYVFSGITSFGHRDFFTQEMRWGLGIVPLVIGWYVLRSMVSQRATDNHVLWHSLLWSIILFGAGGVIGFAIREVNTVIPAHYHGSIVGVTIALMGVCYYLFPKLGFGAISPRLTKIQPYLYGSGALLHIIGFAMAGGYGAMRKTAGAAPNPQAEAWIEIMRFGGALTILGGALFVWLALRSIFKR